MNAVFGICSLKRARTVMLNLKYVKENSLLALGAEAELSERRATVLLSCAQ